MTSSSFKGIPVSFVMTGGKAGCCTEIESSSTSLSGAWMDRVDLRGRLGVTVGIFAWKLWNIIQKYNYRKIVLKNISFIFHGIFLARSVLCCQEAAVKYLFPTLDTSTCQPVYIQGNNAILWQEILLNTLLAQCLCRNLRSKINVSFFVVNS